MTEQQAAIVDENLAAYLITEYLSSWSDEKLTSEIECIGSSAVAGRFADESTGKMYALLRIEQMRREGR